MTIRTSFLFLIISIFLFVSCNQKTKVNIDSRSSLIKKDSLYTPNIGGIKQVIKIQTDNTEKPVILLLAGGPGGSSINTSSSYTEILKDKFTIVEWDQRNVEKTYALNPSPIDPTIKLMSNDTYEVINFILKELNKEKVHLLGMSWGNVLGFNTVKNHPELLHSYFAVNTMTNQLESEKNLLKTLTEYYKDDSIASKELSTVVVPFNKDEDLFYLRKWMMVKNGDNYSLTDNYKIGYDKWIKKWKSVYDEVMQINLAKTLKKADCPVYFFTGSKDVQTLTKLTEQYFKQLKAPKKELIIFEKSGHGIHHSEPVKFQNTIIDLVNPKV